MSTSIRTQSLVVVLLIGAFYATVGVVFAKFAPDLLWRRLAWLVSAMAFAAHIAYEHFVFCYSPRTLARHVGAAAALGAFGLAAAANLRGWSVAAANHRALGIALVAWPILVGVPAFIGAMIAALVARRVWPRRND
jgi:hypothetical protein